ncbi:restriction endonuclease subunit S [Mycoplasmopsis felis]|uniref:restriction endonuclease subunit S n=1 Tax=Mycoplasmopsis felis TaxID=33923 RepID=UPI002AFE5C49|nr:restriction endonuclease subunit S [Mycoplasmopsis felis]WQQ05361.1 restriction endonuclease subunit S [Mycoplasmopsis felis]
MKKVLVPRVRFKGFSEEWKEERLENIYSFASEGGTPDTNKDIYYKPGLFYFTKIEDMANKYIYHTKSKISELGLKNSSAWIIPKNNILFSNGATIGNVSINKVDLSTKQGIVGMIIKKKFNLEFIYYLLKSENFQSKIAEKITVGTIPTVAIFNLKKIELFLSKNIYEQQKIGKLLENIDNLISLEQSKLNKLKQLRETLLQKMFPEGNSKTPRIRFKGFEGEWSEEKLEEVGQTYIGLSGKTKKDFGHGNSRYITYLNIFNNPIANLKGLDRIEEDCKQNSVKYGDIFVTTSSEIPEEVGITSIWPFKDKENIYLNSFCFGIRLNNINNYYINFLAYNLRNNELRKDIVLLAQGISRFNISNRRFMKLNILLPNISEQQKIGDFFCKIDTLINLYNSKLNKLKQIKEALLQKMFV